MIITVFAVNLLFTIAVEGGVMALLFRRLRFVYYSFLCNILTNPALNLLLLLAVRFLGPGFYYPVLAVLEIAVVCIEAYVYRLLCGFSALKSLGVSALLNAASFGAGLLFYSLAGQWFV